MWIRIIITINFYTSCIRYKLVTYLSKNISVVLKVKVCINYLLTVYSVSLRMQQIDKSFCGKQ